MVTLSTTDAFFVAYQERSGILMHFGAEIELAGAIDRAAFDAAIAHALERWPVLAQCVRTGIGGLRWNGVPQPVLVETTDAGEIERWRNAPIDPFREPPFGVLWLRRSERAHAVTFRCHHAVADGQLFFAIVAEVLGALAVSPSAAPATRPAAASAAPNGEGPHPLALRQLWRDAKLGASWREARTLAREARADRSARVVLREVAPGGVAICDRRLDDRARRAIAERASAAAVRSPWLVAAAWMQAIHEWNARRGSSSSLLSLEVPVSMRRGAHAMAGTGNHLCVLTLFADASAPIGELARGLWRDYADGYRRRAHLAVPLLATPARLLPWPVFRRVAVTPASTGFATTHFTWLAHEPDVRAEVRTRSAGAVAMTDQRIYTPVCLRMGVALSVLAWPDELQLAITHRLTGISIDDANELADLVVSRLGTVSSKASCGS